MPASVVKLPIGQAINMSIDDLWTLLREVQENLQVFTNIHTSTWYARNANIPINDSVYISAAETNELALMVRKKDLRNWYRKILIKIAKESCKKKPRQQVLDDLEKQRKRVRGKFDRLSEFSVGDRLVHSDVYGAWMQTSFKVSVLDKRWDILRGKVSLPTFKSTRISVPIKSRRERATSKLYRVDGRLVFNARVTRRNKPILVINEGRLNGGEKAILRRIMSGEYLECDYKIVEHKKKLTLNVCYKIPEVKKSPGDNILGVDFGYSCPVYGALYHGSARLGYRAIGHIARRVKQSVVSIHYQRRAMRRGDVKYRYNGAAGHGYKRAIQSNKKLQGLHDGQYTDLNNKLALAVVDFAANHGCSVIQLEKLSFDNKNTFLGKFWRWAELRDKICYKAEKYGIEVVFINPQYTSRRCHKCGWINNDFTFRYRNSGPNFECPKCKHNSHPDYNAAKNLAVPNIDGIIKEQIEKQGLTDHSPEAVNLVQV